MPSTQYFSLRITPSESKEIIISISKKVSKNATVRNGIRRRMRPIIRELSATFKKATYLFVVKPGAEALRGEVLRDQLAQLLKKS